MYRKLKYEFVIILLLICLCCACLNHTGVKDKKITVAGSIYPLLDWGKNVGGTQVEVICLLPPGASPHTFEPSPQVVRQLQQARILFKIGRGIDDWGDKIIKTSNHSEVKTVILSDNMPKLTAFETEHHINDHEHAHFIDPHIWLDPVLAQMMVLRIADELSRLAPQAKSEFFANAEDYIQQLRDLHL
ncbi:MAG: metal ABC transporter substrate-binding protein, partial [Candidatus Sumerlaeia bacterium]|nr:metal ABC transporter substrate-binding protein [Candidatus Sumerlaeia bacterium]